MLEEDLSQGAEIGTIERFPEGPPFDVVLADPPWRYSFAQSRTRKIENHYPTLGLEEIKALGPRLPLAKKAALFLWATAPKLIEALEVMRAWGFEYKTQAVWDKQSVGMGYWFRGRHELLLVGTRGEFSPPQPAQRVPSVFSKRRGQHSKKPEEVRAWIERAFPGARKLELFARAAKPGWSVWGNEVRSSVAI
jgi:N6-adenosine-specific RNA methylase IME4